ncbi:MAG: class II fructose-1,6-bisphosphate aldolase [Clostridiales bacterium]|jgi:fructose-bisphosphate aldolase class II|nr:class II fructose-1,6-bisphosphate aldolase [Clostridiales bacterium]
MPLVNTEKMFKDAYAGNYAIGAFNINNMELVQGVVQAAKDEKAPLILQISNGAKKYANIIYLKKLVEAAIEDSGLPIAMHLDHGDSFDNCKWAVDQGFTSVMIDASHHSFEENIKITKKVVEYAKQKNVSVEAELGRLEGIEDDINVSSKDASFTQPEQVEEFVSKTGVNSLAIAIGTSHGPFKFKGTPQLRFDILEECERRLPGFPIVLHGASSILPNLVDTIVDCGGVMMGAKGVPEDMLIKATSMAVCKINIDSDLRMAFTAGIRKHFKENPSHYDPRQYCGTARELLTQIVKDKLKNVLRCSGKASL